MRRLFQHPAEFHYLAPVSIEPDYTLNRAAFGHVVKYAGASKAYKNPDETSLSVQSSIPRSSSLDITTLPPSTHHYLYGTSCTIPILIVLECTTCSTLSAVAVLSAFITAASFGTATPTARHSERAHRRHDKNIPDGDLINSTTRYLLQNRHSKGNGSADIAQNSQPKVRGGTEHDAPWPLYQLSALTEDPSDEIYYYLDNAGQGVDVYIIDTGIKHPQEEFNDENGKDRVTDLFNFSTDDDYSDVADDGGHGTFVASAIGGNKYGVAKAASLFNVKYERMGNANAGRLARALNAITIRHNDKKTQDGFKGSIINMSLGLAKTDVVTEALQTAADAGISLVASAGNNGYEPDHFPSSDPNVISVASSDEEYTLEEDSNYGENVITLWAPGQNVPLCNKDGKKQNVDGTSNAAGYVTGILAIFYGVEGTKLNPTTARARLMAQTDNWIDLPEDDDIDFHNSPLAFANTGNRKGAAQKPPVQYIDGPPVAAASVTSTASTSTATATPSVHPTQGCQSPDHTPPFTSFTLAQGEYGLSKFNKQCQGVELKKGGTIGCTLYFNPCLGHPHAANVEFSVSQSEWALGSTSTKLDVQEIQDAGLAIMNDCDTTTTSKKWGGLKSIKVASGMRLYTIHAFTLENHSKPPNYIFNNITSEETGEDCTAWDSRS